MNGENYKHTKASRSCFPEAFVEKTKVSKLLGLLPKTHLEAEGFLGLRH